MSLRVTVFLLKCINVEQFYCMISLSFFVFEHYRKRVPCSFIASLGTPRLLIACYLLKHKNLQKCISLQIQVNFLFSLVLNGLCIWSDKINWINGLQKTESQPHNLMEVLRLCGLASFFSFKYRIHYFPILESSLRMPAENANYHILTFSDFSIASLRQRSQKLEPKFYFIPINCKNDMFKNSMFKLYFNISHENF